MLVPASEGIGRRTRRATAGPRFLPSPAPLPVQAVIHQIERDVVDAEVVRDGEERDALDGVGQDAGLCNAVAILPRD